MSLTLAVGIAATAASAVEVQFGCYWRTRFIFENNFGGTLAAVGVPATNDTGSITCKADCGFPFLSRRKN